MIFMIHVSFQEINMIAAQKKAIVPNPQRLDLFLQCTIKRRYLYRIAISFAGLDDSYLFEINLNVYHYKFLV